MPAERIATNLAFINWTVLIGLAVGSFAAVVVGRRTSATRGYLAFVALTTAAFAALAWWADTALPADAATAAGAIVDADWRTIREVAIAALALAALAAAWSIGRGRDARIAIGIGGIAAAGTLAAGAGSWGGNPGGGLLLLVQLGVLAAATGGVWAAMVLGHWYLVTPRLPEAPLVLFARLLTAITAVQLGLFVVWVATGAGPGGAGGLGALTGTWALFVWLRLIVGIAFPLVVSWAAIQTARTRSMESATGLLYINVGTIAAGTILAAGLYFGAGLLV